MVGGADFTAVGDDCAEGRLIRGFSFALGFGGLVGVKGSVPGCQVPGLAVGVGAGLLLSGSSRVIC